MTLNPGDAVAENACTRVGNFPFAMLQNPDSLASAFGVPGLAGTIPLASEKADYLLEFTARQLSVCNESGFAVPNGPFAVSLRKSFGRILYRITFAVLEFQVGQVGPGEPPYFYQQNHVIDNSPGVLHVIDPDIGGTFGQALCGKVLTAEVRITGSGTVFPPPEIEAWMDGPLGRHSGFYPPFEVCVGTFPPIVQSGVLVIARI